MPENQEPMVPLARIGAPHGVRGGLNVSQAGEHLRRFTGKKVSLLKPRGEAAGVLTAYIVQADFTLFRAEPAKGQITRVQFSEVADRDAAAALTHANIAVSLKELLAVVMSERKDPNPPLAELWYFELVGITVLDAETGEAIGTISAVEDLGLNTVVTIAPVQPSSPPLDIPLTYPHWQTPDLARREVRLSEWRVFGET